MKVIGLDERTYNLDLCNSRILGEYETTKSSLHKKAKEIIVKLYPFDVICEEVYIPGCFSKLYLDFLIPNRKIAIEIQGQQHTEYIRHLHGEVTGFLNSLKRDNLKRQWCELNNIQLVELDYNESITEWTKKLI